LKTRLVLGLIILAGVIALGAYFIYKRTVSADVATQSFEYGKCTITSTITRDPNINHYGTVHLFDVAAYQQLKQNSSAQVGSVFRMDQSQPTTTVPTMLNKRYYVVIHKPDGKPVLNDNASFLCHQTKTVNIQADFNAGTVGVADSQASTDPGEAAGYAVGTEKCLEYPPNIKKFKKTDTDKWVSDDGNITLSPVADSYIDSIAGDPEWCGLPASTATNPEPLIGSKTDDPSRLQVGTKGSRRAISPPLGTSSVRFQATRVSMAAGGKQFTAVGGVHYRLRTRYLPTTQTGKSNSNIAYAQNSPDGNTEGGLGGTNTDGNTEGGLGGTTAKENEGSPMGGFAPTYNGALIGGIGGASTAVSAAARAVSQALSNAGGAMGRIFSRIEPLEISGTIPDNGTKSLIEIDGLPAGNYSLELTKDGYKRQTADNITVNGLADLGSIPMQPNSGAEPPSTSLTDIRQDPQQQNFYYAYSGQTITYIYNSKCPDYGWTSPDWKSQCKKLSYIGGVPVPVGDDGRVYSTADYMDQLQKYRQLCMSPQASIFVDSNKNGKKVNPLKGAMIGALAGIFGAAVSDDSKSVKENISDSSSKILGLAALGGLTAYAGADMNYNIGNALCPNYQAPSFDYPFSNNGSYHNGLTNSAWGLFDTINSGLVNPAYMRNDYVQLLGRRSGWPANQF